MTTIPREVLLPVQQLDRKERKPYGNATDGPSLGPEEALEEMSRYIASRARCAEDTTLPYCLLI